MIKKELKVGMRIRLIKGTSGRDVGIWSAGEVPVGSVGTVYSTGDRVASVKFDGIDPKKGCHFGLTSDCLYNDKYELFEEVV